MSKKIWTIERKGRLWEVRRGGVTIYADEFIVGCDIVVLARNNHMTATMSKNANQLQDPDGNVIV